MTGTPGTGTEVLESTCESRHMQEERTPIKVRGGKEGICRANCKGIQPICSDVRENK